MAVRAKGSFGLAGAMEIKADAPVDARTIVNTKTDLTTSGSFPYKYVGMEVFVKDELKKYILIGNDTTVLANWREQGSGSSDSPIVISYTDYQALTTEEKNDGKVRYVYDYPSEDGGAGSGVPDGGTTGQVLKKLSDLDGDADWVDDTAEALTAEEIAEIKAAFVPNVEPIDLSSLRVEGQTIQTNEMPLASAGEVGKVYQYIGTTTEDYKKGHFYECKEDSNTYTWEELPQGPDISEGTGIDIDEDGTISVEVLTEEEVQDIKDGFLATNTSPFATAYAKYSTNETVVGEWIDGKPVYQKTITVSTPTYSGSGQATQTETNLSTFGINNVSFIIDCKGFTYNNDDSAGICRPINSPMFTPISASPSGTMAGGSVTVIPTKTTLRIQNSVQVLNGKTNYITLQYTKTTD